MASFNWPVLSATVSQGPLQFSLDGVPVEVQEDTGTPANSVPLPVKPIDGNGNEYDFATQTTLAALEAKASTEAKQDTTITAIDSTNTKLDTANTNLGTIDSSIGTTNTKLDTIDTSIGSTNTKLDTANTNLGTINTSIGTTNSEIGATNETAPASDTASSGLNGRLQRVAQRLTSLIAILPASLGQKTMANSLAVTVSSDQAKFPISLAPPVASSVKQAVVSVGTSAVRATTDGSAPSATRVLLTITPDRDSSARFFLGSSSVTTTSTTRGQPILPGQTVSIDNDAGDYYIISDTAAQTVFVMEQE